MNAAQTTQTLAATPAESGLRTRMHPLGVLTVEDEDRINFLPKHFGRMCMEFEKNLIAMATLTIKGYHGGYWEFAYTDSQLPFLFPDHQATYKISNAFQCNQTDVPPVLAGIHTTTLAILNILQSEKADQLSDDQFDDLCELHQNLIGDGFKIAADHGLSHQWFSLVD